MALGLLFKLNKIGYNDYIPNKHHKMKVPILYINKDERVDNIMNYNLYMLATNFHFWWCLSFKEKNDIYFFIKNNPKLKLYGLSDFEYRMEDLLEDLSRYILPFERGVEYLMNPLPPGLNDVIVAPTNPKVFKLVTEVLGFFKYEIRCEEGIEWISKAELDSYGMVFRKGAAVLPENPNDIFDLRRR